MLELELAKYGSVRAGQVVVKVQEKGWVTPEGLCLRTYFVAASTSALDAWVSSLPRPLYVHLCRGTEAHCQYELAGRPIIHGDKWRRRRPREEDEEGLMHHLPEQEEPSDKEEKAAPRIKRPRRAASGQRSLAGSSSGLGAAEARDSWPLSARLPPVPEVPGADFEHKAREAALREEGDRGARTTSGRSQEEVRVLQVAETAKNRGELKHPARNADDEGSRLQHGGNHRKEQDKGKRYPRVYLHE